MVLVVAVDEQQGDPRSLQSGFNGADETRIEGVAVIAEVHDDVRAAVLGVVDCPFGEVSVHVPIAGEGDSARLREEVGKRHAASPGSSGTSTFTQPPEA